MGFFLYYNRASACKIIFFLEALSKMLQRKTGHWVYSRVVPHYPITATCYCPTCMKMDLARCWCPRCHPEISLKSLHHFIFHELSYQTSPVFPSQFHGYHVSARDCEFVFAMRSSLLSGRGCSRRGLDPSLSRVARRL